MLNRTHRHLAPLAALALALRNVGARMMADANPDGYDNATQGLTPAPSGIDSAPDAYTAIGSDGFGMFGAYGTVDLGPCDELTGADGFLPSGELAGIGTDTHTDAMALDLASAPELAVYDTGLKSTRGTYVSGCEGLTDTTELSDSHTHCTPADHRAYLSERADMRQAVRDAERMGDDATAERLQAELDDMSEGHSGRVGHERDAHVSAELERCASEARNVRGSDGQLTELARMRVERFGRLWAYIVRFERTARWGRSDVGRKAAGRKVDTARKGIGERYRASVAQCKRSTGSKAPWAGLYLTRLQAELLGAVPTYTRLGWADMLGRGFAVAGLLAAVNAQPLRR